MAACAGSPDTYHTRNRNMYGTGTLSGTTTAGDGVLVRYHPCHAAEGRARRGRSAPSRRRFSRHEGSCLTLKVLPREATRKNDLDDAESELLYFIAERFIHRQSTNQRKRVFSVRGQLHRKRIKAQRLCGTTPWTESRRCGWN